MSLCYSDIMALRSHRFHPYGPPSVPAGLAPNWYHRDRAHHMNFRILEYVSIDRRSEYVNPFRNGQTYVPVVLTFTFLERG